MPKKTKSQQLVRIRVATPRIEDAKALSKKKSKKCHHARKQVRGPDGKFVKKVVYLERTPEQRADTMNFLYNWRDERRMYRQHMEKAKKEARWAPLRSIFLVTLMSAVLVGLLIAGVQAG
jgi:hypothetical protein